MGVTSYAWAEEGSRILAPLQGNVSIQDGPDAPLRTLIDGASGPALDPQLSPDGAFVAYAQATELYVVPAEGGEPRQVTHGAHETGKTNGLAEFIAQEEMARSERGRRSPPYGCGNKALSSSVGFGPVAWVTVRFASGVGWVAWCVP